MSKYWRKQDELAEGRGSRILETMKDHGTPKQRLFAKRTLAKLARPAKKNRKT